MVLREITFELCKVRPSRSEACLNLIGGEMAKKRRLIIIDEADLLPPLILEMLRNLNERFACPVMFIGEEELKAKVEKKRRISSRMRHRMEFEPVTQVDIHLFFLKALNIKIAPEVSAVIHKHSKGDWRPVITTALALERALKANNLKEITQQLVKDVTGNS